MDGVIIESNTVLYNHWNTYFNKKFDIQLSKEEFGNQLGRSSEEFGNYFLKKYSLNIDINELWDNLHDKYKNPRDIYGLKIGVEETLKLLSMRYKIALATGAPKNIADDILIKFNIKKYFDFVIGGDEVKKGKPNPEIFLLSAKGLELEPHECIVVEDAMMGLIAAKKAGMKCIIMEDELTKYQDHSKSDVKINDFSKLIKEISKL